MLLEIAVFNVEDAVKAFKVGAYRLEVCSDYRAGGITCNETDLTKIRNLIPIPLFAIVRPRAGDFIYNDDEFLQMQQTILLCKKLKYDGIVLGILKDDNTIDAERTTQLVELAHPLPVTFHRAFDKVSNMDTALTDAINTGCKRILTSGGKPSAFEGKEVISKLINKAGNKILILPGGGIRSNHLPELLEYTKASEFHSSAITHNNRLDDAEIIEIIKILNEQSPQLR